MSREWALRRNQKNGAHHDLAMRPTAPYLAALVSSYDTLPIGSPKGVPGENQDLGDALGNSAMPGLERAAASDVARRVKAGRTDRTVGRRRLRVRMGIPIRDASAETTGDRVGSDNRPTGVRQSDAVSGPPRGVRRGVEDCSP
jgi:hypothetical protein